MKKKYETPKAEIVVFDYTESVRACSNVCWWFGFCIPACNYNTQPQQTQGQEDPNNRNNQNNQPNQYYAPGWGLNC